MKEFENGKGNGFAYYGVVLPAAGESRRFGGNINKLLVPLGPNRIPVIVYTIKAFFKAFPGRVYMVIPVNKKIFSSVKSELERFFRQFINNIFLIEGGKTRTESVYAGLQKISEMQVEFTAIHDAARPLIRPEIIRDCFFAAEKLGNIVLTKKSTDTLKYINKDNIITGTVNRENVVRIETPQIFRTDRLKKAYECAVRSGSNFTDDSSVMELINEQVYVMNHNTINIKITYMEDIFITEKFISG